MKRKRIIVAAGAVVLLFALFLLFAQRGDGDVSKVRIGFAGYEVVDGKRSLVLIVTNGSSHRISQPEGHYSLLGESPDGTMMMSSDGMHMISCGFGTANWGWWQLELPKIPSIAPGATFRFTIPVDERPYTWNVTVPFTTIPFRDRLPFALSSRWPSSKRDTPITFTVSPPPIPPATSQVLSAASVIESKRTR